MTYRTEKLKTTAPEKQAGQKRDSDLYKYPRFKEHFTGSRVIAIKEAEGAKAYLIEAIQAGEKFPEQLILMFAQDFFRFVTPAMRTGRARKQWAWPTFMLW